MDFARTPAASGTGLNTPRQQINTISSYIDSSNGYGVTDSRLEWLRTGPVDAFVGMVSERHVPGTEFGELQLAMWTKQFEALRDGDRFFYRNDPVLQLIERLYGISYRHTLADLIRLNTGTTVQPNVFKVAG